MFKDACGSHTQTVSFIASMSAAVVTGFAAAVDFACDKARVLGDTIKGTQ